jgi:hypothetical protein
VTPGTYPIFVYRGDSYNWQFTLWQDTIKTQPVDLTGVTGKAEIRTAAAGTLITSMVVTITQPNILNVRLPATNSALLTKVGGFWDLQLTYTNSDVQTVVSGSVTVTMDVTDSAASLLLVETEATDTGLPLGPRRIA